MTPALAGEPRVRSRGLPDLSLVAQIGITGMFAGTAGAGRGLVGTLGTTLRHCRSSGTRRLSPLLHGCREARRPDRTGPSRGGLAPRRHAGRGDRTGQGRHRTCPHRGSSITPPRPGAARPAIRPAPQTAHPVRSGAGSLVTPTTPASDNGFPWRFCRRGHASPADGRGAAVPASSTAGSTSRPTCLLHCRSQYARVPETPDPRSTLVDICLTQIG